jgi:DNA-binding HxlR family transcriptional regulator
MAAAKPYTDPSPLTRALNIAGAKWVLVIIRELLDGPVRFVDIKRRIDARGSGRGISTEQLRACLVRMTADGLLTRRRYREVPPRVTYGLTDKGRALKDVIDEWQRWGEYWTERP